jgi:hypothetical protein
MGNNDINEYSSNEEKEMNRNSETFLKNVSVGSPFEISIEFRQKSLKNYDFC